MKYMLVRDPRLRPSIENVLKRFEHVHALLVSTTGAPTMGLTNYRPSIGGAGPTGLDSSVNNSYHHPSRAIAGFESVLEQATAIMMVSQNVKNSEDTSEPFYIRIMEDVSLCNYQWFKKCSQSMSDPESAIN